MCPAVKNQRRVRGRRVSLEPLESRQLLSNAPGAGYNVIAPSSPAGVYALPAAIPQAATPQPTPSAIQSVVTTVPSDGAQLTQSPDSLMINFNQEVDFLWVDGDVMLDRVNSDGSTTPLFDSTNLPAATFDAATGSQVTIPLSQSLPVGHYRMVLVANSDVSNFMGDGLWDPTSDLTLADFTIIQKGVTLSDATNLGTLGTQVQTVSGALNFATGSNPVALYKFTVAPGHYWQVGVELDAQRINSNLQGALSLFQVGADNTLHVVATRDSGTGLSRSPVDPYLFVGLSPGVYYLGVSGANNLVGQSGGYDPIGGTVGSRAQSQLGGVFSLELVADPDDAPVQVTGFTLDWQDPLAATPTGFTLTFSGPVDLNSLRGTGGNQTALQLVDAAGKSWTLRCVYAQNTNQVSFVFGSPLAAGQYRVFNSPAGGLLDLTGRAVVGSSLTRNLLATLQITPRVVAKLPNNLGVLWPSLTGGISTPFAIAPAQQVVYRVVIPATGSYSLRSALTLGSLSIQRLGPDGVVVLGNSTSPSSDQYKPFLTQGVYLFTLSAGPSLWAVGRWSITPSKIDFESLVDNGLGQGAALSLRLVNPTTPTPGMGNSYGTSTGTPENVTVGSNSSSSPSSVSLGVAAVSSPALSSGGLSPIPSSLLVTVNSGLLGGSSAQTDQIAAVGPAVPGATVALTDSASGLLPGILYTSRGTTQDQAANRPDEAVGQSAVAVADRESAGSSSTSAETRLEAAQRSAQADAAALVQADRLAGIAATLGRLFSPGGEADEALDSLNGQTTPQELLADATAAQPDLSIGEPNDTRADRIEHAEIGVPTTLLLASAAAYRLRQLTSRWWRRSRDTKSSSKRPRSSGLGPGPRFFRKKTGATGGQMHSQRH